MYFKYIDLCSQYTLQYMLFITWKCLSEGFRLDNRTDCSMNLALHLAVII